MEQFSLLLLAATASGITATGIRDRFLLRRARMRLGVALRHESAGFRTPVPGMALLLGHDVNLNLTDRNCKIYGQPKRLAQYLWVESVICE